MVRIFSSLIASSIADDGGIIPMTIEVAWSFYTDDDDDDDDVRWETMTTTLQ